MIRSQAVHGDKDDGFPGRHLCAPRRECAAGKFLPRHTNPHRRLRRAPGPFIDQIVQVLVAKIQKIRVPGFQHCHKFAERLERPVAKVPDGRVEVKGVNGNDRRKTVDKTIFSRLHASSHREILRNGGLEIDRAVEMQNSVSIEVWRQCVSWAVLRHANTMLRPRFVRIVVGTIARSAS